ncbi:MAG: pyruvate ferredoxin oxidoreductase subunit gamma [bacterium]
MATLEIRIHGRGGQGAVTAAELIATAAFYDGQFSQAFPSFGVERRGAPLEAYARIDNKFIKLRSQVYQPDFIILQDPTLIGPVNILAGAKPNTLVIVNTVKKPEELGLPKSAKVMTVPATEIANKTLGKPIINTALLGAWAGASGLVKLASLKKAILERFPGELGQKNFQAAQLAFNHLAKDKK